MLNIHDIPLIEVEAFESNNGTTTYDSADNRRLACFAIISAVSKASPFKSPSFASDIQNCRRVLSRGIPTRKIRRIPGSKETTLCKGKSILVRGLGYVSMDLDDFQPVEKVLHQNEWLCSYLLELQKQQNPSAKPIEQPAPSVGSTYAYFQKKYLRQFNSTAAEEFIRSSVKSLLFI